MILYIIIAAAGVIGIAGLVVVTWSIHRTHSRIVARHECLFERVSVAMQRGTAIAAPIPARSDA